MIRIMLVCDWCRASTPPEDNKRSTIMLLRYEMKTKGWVHRSGKDYCPACKGRVKP